MTSVDTGHWTVDPAVGPAVQGLHPLELEQAGPHPQPEPVVGREVRGGGPAGGGQPALHYCTTALLHYCTASTVHYSAG